MPSLEYYADSHQLTGDYFEQCPEEDTEKVADTFAAQVERALYIRNSDDPDGMDIWPFLSGAIGMIEADSRIPPDLKKKIIGYYAITVDDYASVGPQFYER